MLKHRRLRLFDCDGSDGLARHASGARLRTRALMCRREDDRSGSSPLWWRGTNRIALRVDFTTTGDRLEKWSRRKRGMLVAQKPCACPRAKTASASVSLH